ncbi:MAG TPA: peptidogalycan biosysnthesis protein, partial [Gemmatimonadaceae bacterium]
MLRVVEDLAEIPSAQWNALAGDHPFLRHEFFHALHATGCASAQTGWLPQFLALWQGDELQAAMP